MNKIELSDGDFGCRMPILAAECDFGRWLA
jgi:hypothetical protein